MAIGDHLFVNCFGYSHHGIDCGDGMVIHFDFTPKRKLAAMLGRNNQAKICETSIDEFSGGRKIHVREYRREDHQQLFTGTDVVNRARSRIGAETYHLFGNNCEHFAIWCKTDEAFSTQVDSACRASMPLARGVATSLLLRTNPLIPPHLRVAASGISLGISVGSAAGRYFRNRRQDGRERRS